MGDPARKLSPGDDPVVNALARLLAQLALDDAAEARPAPQPTPANDTRPRRVGSRR